MKKIKEISILIIVTAIFYWARAVYAQDGISGTAHDFSIESWTDEICQPCHIPHNSNTSVAAPLWNHELAELNYALYSSSSLQATPEQPGYASFVCLSCHDGTVALDAFGGTSGSQYLTSGDAGYIGTNLSDDHPIGIDWEHLKGKPASCSNCHYTHNPSIFVSDLPFYDGRVECSSCHEPHNKGTGEKFLRISNVGSALCLYCHGK